MLLGRVLIAIGAIVLASIRFAYFDLAKDRMDLTFLALIVIAVLALFLPWERLTSLKIGELEITLEKPEVKSALNELPTERTLEPANHATMSKVEKVVLDLGNLKEAIRRLEPLLQDAKGGRILWIDDHPHMLLPERRLLRAMGFEIVTAIDSENANQILTADNDFDLIVTDAKRKPRKNATPGVDHSLGGVDFIMKRVRTNWDPHIKNMPVIFYSAYDMPSLSVLTAEARLATPSAELCNNPHDLVVKVVSAIWFARSHPLRGPLGKQAHYTIKGDHKR